MKTIIYILMIMSCVRGFTQGSACEYYAYEVVYVKGDFDPKAHRTYVENLKSKKYPKSDYLALNGGFQKMSMFCLSPSPARNASSNGSWFSIQQHKYTDCISRTESTDDNESNGKYHFSLFSCYSVDNKENEYVTWSDGFLIIYETIKHQMIIYHYMDKEEIATAAQELLKEDAKSKKRIDTAYYESGKIKTVTPYTDGKKNGTVKGYYESGKIQSEMVMTNDVPNGSSKGYYENGKISQEIPIVNGKIVGIRKAYWESGTLKYTIPYSADGKRNGVAKEYLENGQLDKTFKYINDVLVE